MKNTFVLTIFFLNCILITTFGNNKFLIKGKILNIPDSTKVFLYNLNSQKNVDSAIVFNNQFTLEGTKKRDVELVLEFIINNEYVSSMIYASDNKILVAGELKNNEIKDLVVKGSKIHDGYKLWEDFLKPLEIQRDSVISILRNNQNMSINDRKELISKFEELNKQIAKKESEFIKTNPSLYISVIKLYYSMNSIELDSLKSIFNLFPQKLQVTKYGKAISYHLKNPFLEVGEKYIDFKASDLNGITHQLSEFKKKYLLVTFCAPGCYPSQLALNQLNKVKEHNQDSLDIVTFFVTDNFDAWKKEVQKFNVDWISLSDLNGGFSEIALSYKAYNDFPTIVLLDKERKIKYLSSGCGDGYFDWFEENILKE